MSIDDIDKLLAGAERQHELLKRTTPIEDDEIMLIIRKSPSWKWRDQTHVSVPGIGKGRIQTDIIPGGGTGCLAWFTYGQIKRAKGESA